MYFAQVSSFPRRLVPGRRVRVTLCVRPSIPEGPDWLTLSARTSRRVRASVRRMLVLLRQIARPKPTTPHAARRTPHPLSPQHAHPPCLAAGRTDGRMDGWMDGGCC